MSLNLHPRR